MILGTDVVMGIRVQVTIGLSGAGMLEGWSSDMGFEVRDGVVGVRFMVGARFWGSGIWGALGLRRSGSWELEAGTRSMSLGWR